MVVALPSLAILAETQTLDPRSTFAVFFFVVYLSFRVGAAFLMLFFRFTLYLLCSRLFHSSYTFQSGFYRGFLDERGFPH